MLNGSVHIATRRSSKSRQAGTQDGSLDELHRVKLLELLLTTYEGIGGRREWMFHKRPRTMILIFLSTRGMRSTRGSSVHTMVGLSKRAAGLQDSDSKTAT